MKSLINEIVRQGEEVEKLIRDVIMKVEEEEKGLLTDSEGRKWVNCSFITWDNDRDYGWKCFDE